MSNANRVAANTPVFWEYYQLGKGTAALGVAANAVVTIPIMSGGVTPNVGGNYIIRRITARNSSGAVTTANIAVSGPISGQITSTQGMATVTTAAGYKDLTLSATFVNSANVTVSATVDPTTRLLEDQFFTVNVLAAAAANNTVEVAIFGELIDP